MDIIILLLLIPFLIGFIPPLLIDFIRMCAEEAKANKKKKKYIEEYNKSKDREEHEELEDNNISFISTEEYNNSQSKKIYESDFDFPTSSEVIAPFSFTEEEEVALYNALPSDDDDIEIRADLEAIINAEQEKEEYEQAVLNGCNELLSSL